MSSNNAREALFGTKDDGSRQLDRSDKGERDRQLLQAQNEMQIELQRLRSAEAVVSATSSAISSIHSKYGTYQSRIESASKVLKSLKSKMEKDDRYIYWSYVVFLVSALWIFLKRVKVVAITQWLASKGVTGISWLYESPSTDGVLLDSKGRQDSTVIKTSSPTVAPTVRTVAVPASTTSTTQYTTKQPTRATTTSPTTPAIRALNEEISDDFKSNIHYGSVPTEAGVFTTTSYPEVSPDAGEL